MVPRIELKNEDWTMTPSSVGRGGFRISIRCMLLACTASLPLAAAHAASPASARMAGNRIGSAKDDGSAIFSLSAYPNAICNDGSPGVYYFRKSLTGSTRWLFYLEGGDECYDDTTCLKTRTNDQPLTTSIGFTIQRAQGIISSDPSINPLFANANVVQVHYCSSDYWSGGKAATTAFLPGNADSGWYFEGRAIAVAAMQDLVARNADTGFSSASDILVAGSSAGGLGVVFTAPDLLPLIPKAALKLFADDAGFSLQINSFAKNNPPNYLSTFNPFLNIVTPGSQFWNGHGNSTCWNRATTPADQITCYDTSAMLVGNTYVSKRTFIAESQIDDNQLNQHNFKGTIDQDAAHMTYATEFADAMKAALQLTTPPNAVFAPQRLTHTMFATNAEFTFPEVFGTTTMTPSAALTLWYNSPTTPFAMYGTQAGLP